MPFCTHCGTQYEDGAKFCSNCGQPLLSGNSTGNQNTKNSSGVPASNQPDRNIANALFCPNCHHALKAFMTQCPSCGCELRNKISSLKDFKDQYNNTVSDEEKIDLIRTYIIPNTREDIIEFAIYASSNINAQVYAEGNGYSPLETLFAVFGKRKEQKENSRTALTEAWVAKFEQSYQKAKLVLADDPYLQELETIRLRKEKEIKKTKKEGKEADDNKLIPLLIPLLVVMMGFMVLMIWILR